MKFSHIFSTVYAAIVVAAIVTLIMWHLLFSADLFALILGANF